MTVSPGSLNRQPVIDLVVAMVSVPLLVVFGLMLESNMRGQWAADPSRRWNVLGLGLALLLISLIVCTYVIHRLGLCIWSAHNRQYEEQMTQQQHQTGMASVSSQLNLVSRGELPPSYESVVSAVNVAVVSVDPPPPYCAVLGGSEKLAVG